MLILLIFMKKMIQFFELKILDKFIIKKYWSTFAYVMIIFTLIACVIDLSEKLEGFKKNHVPISEILMYYMTFIPHINTLLMPLWAFIAVIFFTSRMAFNSEIISILNAGVSFERLMKPYLFGAGVISLLHLILGHFIVPQGNKTRLSVEHKYIWVTDDKGKTDNVHLFLDPTTKVYVQHYNKRDSTVRDLRIEKFDPQTGELVSILKAETATKKGLPPNKWQLGTWQRRTFSGITEGVASGILLDTTLMLNPEDFVRYVNQNEMTTTPELLRDIRKLELRGVGSTNSLETEFYRRTADPFTILILTIIGVALAARKVRGGMGLHLALGIGLGAVFIFISKFSVTFANMPNVPILLGIWIPNILFGSLAFYLVTKAQR